MKVLFISQGGPTQDYLRDAAFHGLRSMLGEDCVDVGKLDSMYNGADRSQMYGKGFSLYGLLPDIQVDRSDITKKISRKHFDLVVYGSIHRNRDYFHEVTSMYRSERIVYLDGEDHPGALTGLPGAYFKREMHNPLPGIHPIQFAIPEEKIMPRPIKKIRLMAPCDPIDKSTYIYDDEQSYYAQYAESYFAATMSKAGHDCLRHYEIMSQWTIPYFRCLEIVPPTIMKFLPRAELLLAKTAYEYFQGRASSLVGIYSDLIDPIMAALRRHMTTAALGLYILDTVGVARKETVCS